MIISARLEATLVPIEMPIICWKTFPQEDSENVDLNLWHVNNVIYSPVYFLFESKCSLTKKGPSRPKTKNMYLSFQCLFQVPDDSC